MKCFSVGSIVCFSLLAISFAAPTPEEKTIQASSFARKEEKAIRECNATYPVQRNIRQIIGVGVATGERIHISQEEKCHFYCFLQKVGFFDKKGKLRGQGLVKYTLKQSPELAKYSDVLICQVFQIARSIKGIEDKCHRAFVAYHQFTQNIFQLYVAAGLQTATGIRDEIVNSIATGQPVDQEVAQQVKKFLEFFDALISAEAKEFEQTSQNNTQEQGSNTQSQASNAKSQETDAQLQGSPVYQQQGQNAQSQVSNAQLQASEVQSQGSSIFQQQGQNAQSEVSNAQSQVSDAQLQVAEVQSQGSSIFQQQGQNAQSQESKSQSQVSEVQSQGSSIFQQQGQNTQSQESKSQSQASKVQSQGSSIFQQQGQNAQSQESKSQSQVSNSQAQVSSVFQQQTKNAQSLVSNAQSQGSSVLQQQAQNAQSQVSNAQPQATNAQSEDVPFWH